MNAIYDSPAQNLLLSVQDPLGKEVYDKEKAKKHKNLLEITIPRLTMLYTFQNMRRITVAKKTKEVEDALRTKRLEEEKKENP